MKTVFISPPFGNYFSSRIDTSKNYKIVPILGTFTENRRPGLIWQIIKTLRKIPGGYRNNIGLRNPGFFNRQQYLLNRSLEEDLIVSVCSLHNRWKEFLNTTLKLELNISCPNVQSEWPFKPLIEKCKQVKISPTYTLSDIERLIDMGASILHCSNSHQGISGRCQKTYNLKLIEEIVKKYNIKIIAGGGIYTPQDVQDYYNACGTNMFSLSTIFFTPWKVNAVIDTIANLNT